MNRHPEGGCLCGEVRYRIDTDDETLACTFCHCSMCRKAMGSPFASLAAVRRDAIAWTRGAPTLYRSSPIATRAFCDRCGTPLYYDGDQEDHLAITVGSLDDPAHVVPDHHYGAESRLPWVDIHPELPAHATTETFEGQPRS